MSESSVTPPGCEGVFIDSVTGGKLYARYWQPPSNIRGLIFLCHGFAEHLQWYEELANNLVKNDFYVFGHDHVGHGKSEGLRAYIDNIDRMVEDVQNHCESIRKKHTDVPLFILGHSMGGLITLKLAVKCPDMFKALVVQGPLIISDDATFFKILFARVVARFFPYYEIASLDVNDVTRNKEIAEQLLADPLRYPGGLKAGMAVALNNGCKELIQQLTAVKTPYLNQHGEKDKVTSPRGSQLLLEQATTEDKTLKLYKDATHNLLLELPEVKDETIKDTVEWLVKRLQA